MIVQDEMSFVKVKNGSDGSDGTDGKDGSNGKDGVNGKDSNMHTAYSWSADGSDRFTDKYPNENLFKFSNNMNGYNGYSGTQVNRKVIDGTDILGVKNAVSFELTKATPNSLSLLMTSSNVVHEQLKFGITYTHSLIIKNTGNTVLSVRYNGLTPDRQYNVKPDETMHIKHTGVRRELYDWFQVHIGYQNATEYSFVMGAEKLEKSTSATIYTPSPQDDFNNAWPTYSGTYSSHDKVQSQNPKDYTWARIRGADGSDGKDGQTPKDVISGYLSNEAIIVPATPTGNVTDYSKAFGDFIVFEGQEKKNSGVTYSKVSEVNMTSTINSAGRYVVSALSADTGTATYRASYAGVTVDKILIVVKNKQGPSGVDGTNGKDGVKGDKGDKGDKGAIGNTGPKGDPTGITVSPTVPTNPYINMLWQNTGSNNGYLTGTVYQWNGAKWNTFIFSAENIVANSLSALSAYLGDVKGGSITGSKIKTDEKIVENYGDGEDMLVYHEISDSFYSVGKSATGKTYSENVVDIKGISGNVDAPGGYKTWMLGAQGFGVTQGKYFLNFGGGGFRMTLDNFEVSHDDLKSYDSTRLSPASGFSVYSTYDENLPRARRFGKTVTLSGAFTNNNNIAKGWSGVIGYLPRWATPSVMHRVLCQGSGSNTFYLQVKPNGELFLERYGTNDTVAFNSGAWLTINTTYLV